MAPSFRGLVAVLAVYAIRNLGHRPVDHLMYDLRRGVLRSR